MEQVNSCKRFGECGDAAWREGAEVDPGQTLRGEVLLVAVVDPLGHAERDAGVACGERLLLRHHLEAVALGFLAAFGLLRAWWWIARAAYRLPAVGPLLQRLAAPGAVLEPSRSGGRSLPVAGQRRLEDPQAFAGDVSLFHVCEGQPVHVAGLLPTAERIVGRVRTRRWAASHVPQIVGWSYRRAIGASVARAAANGAGH